MILFWDVTSSLGITHCMTELPLTPHVLFTAPSWLLNLRSTISAPKGAH